jgi:hypothetical protein
LLAKNASISGTLTMGSGGVIQANYSPGSSGFKLDGATGDAEFNNVTVRGSGSSIGDGAVLEDLTVNGTLLMGSGGKITNSGDDFAIDSDGFLLNVASGSTFQSPRGVKWVDGATDRFRVWSSALQAFVEGVNNTELFVRSNKGVYINSGSSDDIRIGGVGRHILMLAGSRLAPINTTQMNAISSPLNGIMYWNITVNRPVFYDGTEWRQVRSSSV